MALGLHQFAEGLARHVHIPEQLAAGVAPTGQAAIEQGHFAVAEVEEALRGDRRQAFAVVVDGNRRVAARHPGMDLQFQPGQRQVGGEQGMGLGERVLFAHVEQRQLPAGEESGADIVEGTYGDLAHAGFSFDRSQILGKRLLE